MSRWSRPGNDVAEHSCEFNHEVVYVDDETVECNDCGEKFPITEDELVEYHEDIYENYREGLDDDRRHGI
jgi:hypothetical protein